MDFKKSMAAASAAHQPRSRNRSHSKKNRPAPQPNDNSEGGTGWTAIADELKHFRFELISAGPAGTNEASKPDQRSSEMFMSISTFCAVLKMDEVFAHCMIRTGYIKTKEIGHRTVISFESWQSFLSWVDSLEERGGPGPRQVAPPL